jgi:hypothetical protein
VLEQLEHRRHDSETYVMPQRDKADIVISFCPGPDYAARKDSSKLDVKIVLRHPISLPDIDEVVGAGDAQNGGPYIRLHRGQEGTDRLEIGGSITEAATKAIEQRMWSHMLTASHLRSDRLGIFMDGTTARRSNPLAVTQLVLTYYLVKVMALVRKQEQLKLEATGARA